MKVFEICLWSCAWYVPIHSVTSLGWFYPAFTYHLVLDFLQNVRLGLFCFRLRTLESHSTIFSWSLIHRPFFKELLLKKQWLLMWCCTLSCSLFFPAREINVCKLIQKGVWFVMQVLCHLFLLLEVIEAFHGLRGTCRDFMMARLWSKCSFGHSYCTKTPCGLGLRRDRRLYWKYMLGWCETIKRIRWVIQRQTLQLLVKF